MFLDVVSNGGRVTISDYFSKNYLKMSHKTTCTFA